MVVVLQALIQTVIGPRLKSVNIVKIIWGGIVVHSTISVGIIVVSNSYGGVETVAKTFANILRNIQLTLNLKIIFQREKNFDQ